MNCSNQWFPTGSPQLGNIFQDSTTYEDTMIPLLQWKGVGEASPIQPVQSCDHGLNNKKASLIRKVTVAYAVALVIQHLSNVGFSTESIEEVCIAKNFVVRCGKDQVDLGWEVKGVDVVSIEVSVGLDLQSTNRTSTAVSGLSHDGIAGKIINPIITSEFHEESDSDEDSTKDHGKLCQILGRFLHTFLSGQEPIATQRTVLSSDIDDLTFTEPRRKKILPDDSCSRSTKGNVASLAQSGYPNSLSEVVNNLLESQDDIFRPDDCYQSLPDIIGDLLILLQDPERFLFDQYHLHSEKKRIPFHVDKLYGRSKEVAALQEAFHRVVDTGHSEAVCLSGYSGSGKTTLVQQSLYDCVRDTGGYVVVQKFDETSTKSNLSIILAAVNELCGQIALHLPQEEREEVFQRIKEETDLNYISMVFKNISKMDDSASPIDLDIISGVNFLRLSFAVMKLMRILSSKSRPLLLFVDDLQWADEKSLDLVRSIISDQDGTNCILFVGTYRSEAVGSRRFIDDFYWSIHCAMKKVTRITLENLADEDIRAIVSDALGVLPRRCKSLARMIYTKTHGNAFFSIQFLDSLIDQSIVTFSLSQRAWQWNIDLINIKDVSDNVIQLITTKMASLESRDKDSLKVASCFGIKVRDVIVKILSQSEQFSGFNLDSVVEQGFMEYDGSYKFIHDKIREAAYSSINSIDELHFRVGLSLYSVLTQLSQDWSEHEPIVLEQINHGDPILFTCEKDRASIADLNHKESKRTLNCSDFESAYRYSRLCLSLLPDTWTNEQNKYFYQLAKASYLFGLHDEAKSYLNTIITNTEEFQHKIDAQILHAEVILLGHRDLPLALSAFNEVLSCLGEVIPEREDAIRNTCYQVTKAKCLLKDSDTSHYIKCIEWRRLATMQAYSHLTTVIYFAFPDLYPYFVSKWAEYCYTNNIACRYTSECIVSFGGVLCRSISEDSRIGYRLAKQGLAMLDASNAEDIPKTYLLFYGIAGFLFEPLQACIDMHRRGYALGLQAGNLSIAALHKSCELSRMDVAGANLAKMKSEIEAAMQKATPIIVNRLQFYYEKTLALIGEDSTINESNQSHSDFVSDATLFEAQCLNEMTTYTYLGNPERVQQLSAHWGSIQGQKSVQLPLPAIYIPFYCGLAAAQLYRKNQEEAELKTLNDSIEMLERVASFSQWNYKNKAFLLSAELASIEDNGEAEHMYNVSIEAAKSSRFVQEEALACELASKHYKHRGNIYEALRLCHQAQKGYALWGSKIKASQMTNEIKSLSSMVSELADSFSPATFVE